MSKPRRRRSKPSGKSTLPGGVIRYFMDLEVKDLSKFISNWQTLGKHKAPNSKVLSQIFFQSAKTLVHKNKPKFYKAEKPVKYLRHNIHLWENLALPQLHKFNPAQMVKSLWAYANFGLIPSKDFMDKFFECAEEKKDSFKFRDARMGLWSLARMGVIPPQSFLEDCRQTIINNIKDLDAADISIVLWSIAVFDSIEPNERYKKLYDELRDAENMESLSEHQEKQIRDCDMWFYGQTKLNNVVRADKNNKKISKLEGDLKEAFKRASFKVQKTEQPLIPQFKQAIDFPVTNGKKSLWIEVDGPTHYMYRPSTGVVSYNGPTIFRSALINKFAPDRQVLRIGYKRIKEILDKKFFARRRACTKLFNVFTAKAPGVYGINEPEQNRPTDIFTVAPRVPANGNRKAAQPQVA